MKMKKVLHLQQPYHSQRPFSYILTGYQYNNPHMYLASEILIVYYFLQNSQKIPRRLSG